VIGDELVVQPVVLDQLMEDRPVKRGIPPRPDRQMQVGGARDRRQAWIDDDEFGPVVARLPDPMGERGKGLAHIGAAEHNDLSVGEIGVIVRGSVQPKCLLVPRTGADHA